MESSNTGRSNESNDGIKEDEEEKSLLIAQKRDFYSRPEDDDKSDDEGDLFSPLMFLNNESDKPIEFAFAADELGVNLKLSVWCVDRELQHTATAEGEMVWPAAEVLCWYLIKHRSLVQGKRVLELGAGVGLASMVASSLGARRVVATDYDDRSLEKLDKNISQFKVADPIRSKAMRVHQLAWGHALDEFRERVNHSYDNNDQASGDDEGGYFDVMMGSDIIYYTAALSPLMRTVSTLLTSSPNAVFVLANNVNRFGPNREAFEGIVDRSGFHIEEVPLETFLSESNMPHHPSSLLLIKRKPQQQQSS